MTILTDIAIPFASFFALVGVVWGAATLVRGHRAVDDVNSLKIATHDDECKRERASNAAKIRALEDRALKLELGKQDKRT